MSRRMGLAGSVGAPGLWVMAVAASAPMVVLTGGLSTLYAATGLVAVPLMFLVLAAALVPITAAYVAASRHLGHAATCYALLAQGLGRVAGVAGGAVALVSYAAIACSLFGLFGFVVSGMLGGLWWAWALGAWLVVTALGGVSLTANVAVIGVGVGVQLLVLARVVWTAVAHPAEGGLSLTGFTPSALLADGAGGLGGAAAFGIAAFIGYESTASYVEETRSVSTLRRAAFASLMFLGVCYAVAAWAVGIGYGPHAVVDAARDPGSGMPLGLLGGAAPLGVLVLLAAMVLSMASFHHLMARYLFRLGYERVLPEGLGRVGRGIGAGAPRVAWLTQSGVVLAVIVVTVAVGADPYTGLFIPASTFAAIGVLALLTASSWAAGRFFARGGGTNEGRFTRRAAPVLGVLCGGTVLAVVVANMHSLLGVAPGAVSTWLLPALVAVAALVGAARGWWLRRHRSETYAEIGQGQPRHAARLAPRLVDLTL